MTVRAFSGLKNMTADYSSEFILNEKSTHKASVDIIKFTPDSKKIITSANDYTIRVMDTESTMGKTQLLSGKIVASSRDKNSILILSGEKISKYNFDTNKEEFIALAKKIKEKIPDIGLTTDIIVGFPGETDEDFQDTMDVVNEVGFENAFMFMYSKRTGTPAATMEEQVDEQTKNERLQQLMRLQNMKAKEESQKYLGQTVKVLVEGPSRKNPEMLTGRSSTHKIILFKSDRKDLKGQFVNVKIYDAKTWTLYGEMVE